MQQDTKMNMCHLHAEDKKNNGESKPYSYFLFLQHFFQSVDPLSTESLLTLIELSHFPVLLVSISKKRSRVFVLAK